MRIPLRTIFAFFFIGWLITGCTSSWHLSQKNVSFYTISYDRPKDSSVIGFLKPYHDEMGATMEKVIAVSDVELIKKQPSSNMGNLFADIVKTIATQQYNVPVDLSVFNYGGMRLNSVAPGNITLGKIYELSPFDNLIVVVKIKGKVLQDFLNHTAAWGGWPIAGATYLIKDKKATSLLINGQPLDENKEYNMATIDYVANGGDNAAMLTGLPQLNKNIFMRDAIIQYLQKLTAEGKHLVDLPENRVQYAQ